MASHLAAFSGGVLLGLLIGSILSGLLVRRAIILNIRRLADSSALTLFNAQARQYDLKPHQVARMAIREAAIVAAGAKPEKIDFE